VSYVLAAELLEDVHMAEKANSERQIASPVELEEKICGCLPTSAAWVENGGIIPPANSGTGYESGIGKIRAFWVLGSIILTESGNVRVTSGNSRAIR